MNSLGFGIPSLNVVCTKRLIDPMTGEIFADTGDILDRIAIRLVVAAVNRHIQKEIDNGEKDLHLIKFEDHFYD